MEQGVRLKIKVYGPQRGVMETETAIFTEELNEDECDAILIFYSPRAVPAVDSSRVFWWRPEPSWHSMYRTAEAKQLFSVLPATNILFFGNPNIDSRIPHQTRTADLQFCKGERREEHLGAVVSNFGDTLWILRSGFRLRNRFITHPSVQLYGKKASWEQWPHRYLPRALQHLPKNYVGEFGGWEYDAQDMVERLSKFHALVCMENHYEPFYFTEKFPHAAAAGCVPIYHPHATVKEEFLRGAFYIDPADYDMNPDRTFEAARNVPAEDCWALNEKWLEWLQTRAPRTREDQLWELVAKQIAKILRLRGA